MAIEKDIKQGKGYGFISEGKLFLVRCFICGLENYALAVANGQCAWCGNAPKLGLDKS